MNTKEKNNVSAKIIKSPVLAAKSKNKSERKNRNDPIIILIKFEIL